LEAPEFVVAALTWDADEELAPDAVIEVRVREKRGWSAWIEVEADDAGPEDGTGRAGTDPFITGGATAVQVRVDGRPNDLPANLSLELIPAGASGETEVLSGLPGAAGGAGSTSRLALPAMGQGLAPSSVDIDGVGTMFTRADWGADEAYTDANWTPRFAPLRAAVVHHTAGTNTYTAAQSAGVVKAIYIYHAVTRGWGDIGYNFLVDQFGQVFEGRKYSIAAREDAPQDWTIEAGHALGYNSGSLGISALGDFTRVDAPDAREIVDAMTRVISWKFGEARLDMDALSGFFVPLLHNSTTYASGAELPRIFGHGDVAQTACPGHIYDRIGELNGSVSDTVTALNAAAAGDVQYAAHVATIGWLPAVTNGMMTGTVGQSLAMEALRLEVSETSLIGELTANAHVQSIGWTGWVPEGDLVGTTGQSLRLEAIQLKLDRELAHYYDVSYRVHVQSIGWMDWVANGATAGTTGQSLRIEAIQIRLTEKPDPGAYSSTVYNSHVQSIGWMPEVSDGAITGTTGQSLRMEALQLEIDSTEYPGDILYRAHVQSIGWMPWQSSATFIGTVGQSLRMEAVEIKLTGELAEHYTIRYRAHVQSIGWQDYRYDGQTAGTTGQSKRIEAITIDLIPKLP
jgi:uncharacterized protein YjdB